jgi:hypothetical protein
LFLYLPLAEGFHAVAGNAGGGGDLRERQALCAQAEDALLLFRCHDNPPPRYSYSLPGRGRSADKPSNNILLQYRPGIEKQQKIKLRNKETRQTVSA